MIRLDRLPGHTLGGARASIASTFVIHAFVSGSWAPRIPAIKTDLRLDEGQLGIALMGLAVGLVLGTKLAGPAVDRLGMRRPVRIGLPVLCLALVGPAVASGLPTLTVGFVLLGLAGGFLDVAMNANAVALERGYRRPIMSGLHAIWSGGLLAGSAFGTGAAAIGAGVVTHFALVAALLVVASVAMTRGLLSTAEAAARAGGHASPGKAVWSASVLLLGLVAFSSFVGEGAAADWSAVYMTETVGTGTGFAGAAFVAFSLGMIASRLAGDRLSSRHGPAAVARGGGVLASSGLALALVAPSPATAVVGFMLLGAGLGPIVPITFSAAGNVHRVRAGAVLGSVVMIGYVGSVIGPVIIGFTADALSLRVALIFPAVLALGVAVFAFSLAPAAGGEQT